MTTFNERGEMMSTNNFGSSRHVSADYIEPSHLHGLGQPIETEPDPELDPEVKKLIAEEDEGGAYPPDEVLP